MLLRNIGGRLDIAVGRNNLGKFYHDVLPKLREIADVREEHPERMRGLIPPKPTFTAYLDYYKEALLCSAEVSYGKKTYPVTDVIDAAVGKTRLSPYYRDEEAERAYCNVLNRYFDLYDPSMKLMYTDKDDDKLFELLDHGIDELLDCGEVRMTVQFRNLKIRSRMPMKVGINVSNNLLDLTVTSEDLTVDEMYQILFQYRRKKKYIKLLDVSEAFSPMKWALEKLSR